MISMKKFIVLFLLFCSYTLNSSEGWETIQISNWGSIKLPPSMEIQSGDYKRFVDDIKRQLIEEVDRVVFQQKGLNKGENLDTYARIIIRTDKGHPGDFPDLSQFRLTEQDLREFNLYVMQEAELMLNQTNSDIISWTDLTTSFLGGRKIFYYTYTRTAPGLSPVHSEVYMIFNDNMLHTVIFEYYTGHKSKWAEVLEKSKASFRVK